MAEIISIRKMRKYRDPDVFINQVLNDPARLARVKAKQVEAWEKAKKEAEDQERRLEQAEAFQTFTLKLAVAFCFSVTVIAALVAFIC